MIHQTERTGQDLGSISPEGVVRNEPLVYIHKSQSSTEEEQEKILLDQLDDPLDGLDDPSILPYPQPWEKTSFIPKPKTDFIQRQNKQEEVDYILKYHLGGGSGVELKRSTKKPLEFHTQIPSGVRGDRKPSKGFSNKSRRNVLKKLSNISQDLIPSKKVKLLTLTYGGREHIEGKYTPKDCKKHLNSFLVRVRKHLKSRGIDRWFYHWRCDTQVKRYLRLGGSPVLHFHLTLFNVSYISQDWVQKTWSRIVTGWGDSNKNPKDLVRTKYETPRSWNKTKEYISKVLCYVSKDTIDEGIYKYIKKKVEEKKLDQEKSFRRLKKVQNMSIGRVWGIGRYDDYRTFVDSREVKLTRQQTSKLVRHLLKYNKSNLMKSQGEKFNHSRWKRCETYYRKGRITKKYKTCRVHIYEQDFKEFSTFMRGETMEKLLRLLNIPIIECVKDIRTDVVIDFTPDDYSRKVVGL